MKKVMYRRTLWRRSVEAHEVALADPEIQTWMNLTYRSNRAMCTSPYKLKEVADGHREQKPGAGNQTDPGLNHRICYGVELEPKYIDVAIARWESFTGEKARKEDR